MPDRELMRRRAGLTPDSFPPGVPGLPPVSEETDAGLQPIPVIQFLRMLWMRRATVLILAALGALIGLLFLLPQPPQYRAEVAVEVQALNEDFLYSRDVNPNSTQSNIFPEVDLATQARLLRTQSLLSRVKARLASDPSLHIEAPPDRLAAWRKVLHLPGERRPTPDEMLTETAASVRVNPTRNTRIISISCDSGDPKLAAAFANKMASESLDQTLENRWQSAQHTGEWLGRQMDEMKIKLERSEQQLQTYAAAMNLVVTSDAQKVNVSEEKLRQVQAELSAAEAERVSRQARYEQVVSGRIESLGQVVDDASLRTFEVKLADMRRELADLSSTFTPAHYKVQKLQAQIAEMESEQKKARARIAERIYGEFREAERREKLLAAQYESQSALVSDQAGKLVHYSLLQREVETNRQLYETLLHKVKEAGISAALRASNIRIADPAEIPTSPFAPNLLRGSALGLLLGLCGGVALAFIQERADRSIQIPADAAFYLNVPLLGVVPSWSLDRKRGYERQLIAGAVEKSPVLSDFTGGSSAVSEGLRAILTSILFTERRTPLQVMVVSSPGISEGKTTVACNLALAYAEAGRSVLLIDCDMRRPRLHDIFDVPNDSGLASLLAVKEPLDTRSIFRAARSTRYPGVSLLTSGIPENGAANLLHSRRLGEFLAIAREQFDVVLLDTPPLLQLADARIVGSYADGLLMVIRAGHTTRDSAVAARQQLAEDGIPVLGVALNDWNPRFPEYYGYDYYSKGYSGKENSGKENSGRANPGSSGPENPVS